MAEVIRLSKKVAQYEAEKVKAGQISEAPPIWAPANYKETDFKSMYTSLYEVMADEWGNNDLVKTLKIEGDPKLEPKLRSSHKSKTPSSLATRWTNNLLKKIKRKKDGSMKTATKKKDKEIGDLEQMKKDHNAAMGVDDNYKKKWGSVEWP